MLYVVVHLLLVIDNACNECIFSSLSCRACLNWPSLQNHGSVWKYPRNTRFFNKLLCWDGPNLVASHLPSLGLKCICSVYIWMGFMCCFADFYLLLLFRRSRHVVSNSTTIQHLSIIILENYLSVFWFTESSFIWQ